MYGPLSDSQDPLILHLMSQCRMYAMLAIFSVFSEIRDELDSPSLIAWMADLSTGLIDRISYLC